MDKERLDILLDKYLEGLSTLEEEKDLREYFRSEESGEEYEPYRAIFGYIDSERTSFEEETQAKKPAKTKRIALRYGIGAAAACIILLLALKLTLRPSGLEIEKSYAYIDGEKYTDMILVRQQALQSLEDITTNEDSEVISSQINLLDSLFE